MHEKAYRLATAKYNPFAVGGTEVFMILKEVLKMSKNYDDSNWREEYKGYTSSKYELDLLEEWS